MSLYDIDLTRLDGRRTTFGEYRGDVVLAVNVASKCGMTPQYAALQLLQDKFADRGFTVLGFPCNQFLFQEPGSAETIAEFCTNNYAVTFPMFEKLKVRGRGQHPLFAELTKAADATGTAGAVKWNFEKFLVGRDGRVTGRYRSKTTPDDPRVLAALETALAAEPPAA